MRKYGWLKHFGVYALAVGLLVSPFFATQAQAPIHGLATEAVFHNLFQRLESLLENARRSGDFLVSRGAQEAIFVLDAFAKSNEELLEQAFDHISTERQAVLNGVRDAVDALESGRVDTLERLTALSDQFDGLARTAIFRNEPVIYRYRGAVVVPGDSRPVRLIVEGYNLVEGGTPRLRLGDREYSPLVDGKRLLFEVPREVFRHTTNDYLIMQADLELRRKGRSVMGVSVGNQSVTHKIGFIALPSRVGSVTVEYRDPVRSSRRSTQVYQPYLRAEYRGQGWRCTPYSYRPQRPHARVDLARSRVDAEGGNSNGQIRNVVINETGIAFEICARWGVADRGPGYRHAKVTLVETWEESGFEPRSVSQPLLWNQDLAIRGVNRGARDLVIQMVDFTKNTGVQTHGGGMLGRFAFASYDVDSGVVVIRPRVPAYLTVL